MFNSTAVNQNTTVLPSKRDELWIAAISINFSLIILSIWLACTVGLYGTKSGKFQKKKNPDFNGGLILKLLLFTAVAVMPRLLATTVVCWIVFYTGEDADHLCEIAMDITTGTYYTASVPAYIFLWMRQRSLYKQPSISRLYTNKIKFLNWGSLIFISSAIGIVVYFVEPVAYKASPRGCVLRENENQNLIPFYILSGVLVTGQLSLLLLFIYPLYLHRNLQFSDSVVAKTTSTIKQSHFVIAERDTSFYTDEPSVDKLSPAINRLCPENLSSSAPSQRFLIGLSSQNNNDKQLNPPSYKAPSSTALKRRKSKIPASTSKRLKQVMKRSVVSALICCLSDLTALAFVSFVISRKEPRSFTNAIVDISLIVNIISLICSFDTYKKIFKSPCSSSMKLSKTSTTSKLSNNEESKSKNSIY